MQPRALVAAGQEQLVTATVAGPLSSVPCGGASCHPACLHGSCARSSSSCEYMCSGAMCLHGCMCLQDLYNSQNTAWRNLTAEAKGKAAGFVDFDWMVSLPPPPNHIASMLYCSTCLPLHAARLGVPAWHAV